jgi:mono/diheme cytochrome c family protein
MKLETRAALIALIAGLFVVGASYGVSALVSPPPAHEEAAHRGGQGHQEGAGKDMTAMGAMPSSQLVSAGRSLYTQACSSCHGDNAEGGYGPNLHGLGQSDAQIGTVIKNGVTGKMPAFGGKYTAAQQQALVTYVQSLKK